MSAAISRRHFMKTTAVSAAGAALPLAGSSRVMGANERLQIGIVGPGPRGRRLLSQVFQLSDQENVEIAAVCDIWKTNLENAAGYIREQTGWKPRQFRYLEDMLAWQDLDGVIVSTPDFQHALMLTEVVAAGKDCYCEKPLANRLDEAKLAFKTVIASNRVVQIGTQLRSLPRYAEVRKHAQSGVLGTVSKIDIMRNTYGPRWLHREETAELKEQDTDWKRWLMNRPYRPFDPELYFTYRIYKGFSTGIIDQWMCHSTDTINYIMGTQYPVSTVAHGGTYVYNDRRENGDHCHVLIEYPGRFLVSYQTGFGNNYPGHNLIMGTNGTIEFGGPWKISGKGGGRNNENPKQIQRETEIQDKKIDPIDNDLLHMRNWLQCMRSRQKPNAGIFDGYMHSVVCIMSAQSLETGRRLYWDPVREEISEQEPVVYQHNR